MAQTIPRIGFAGAGLLGSAIIKRLLDCGFPVTAWNRSADRLAPVVEAGAQPAATPAEMARDADIVMTCVTDARAVEEIVFGPDGVATTGRVGKLLVDMSSIDPNATKAMAERLAEACRMGWVDAPISGGAPAAATGSMTVMVGASEEDFRAVAPVMDALAGRATLMGPVGAGQTTKLINQVIVSCAGAMLAEATVLAQNGGVDALRIPDALAGGRADSRLLQEMMPKMAKPDFTPMGRNKNMVKDLEMVHDLAKATGTPMPVTALVTELHRQLVLEGLGDHCNSTIVTLFQDPAVRRRLVSEGAP